MRLTTVLLIATIMQVSAIGFAQRVTLKQNGSTIKQVFKEVKKQTGYDILYKVGLVKDSKKINAQFSNTELKEVLRQCLEGQNLDFSIYETTVVIKPKQEPTFLDQVVSTLAHIDVRGRVTDESDNALSGAVIKVKGTNRSTSSNDKGEFFLRSVDEKAVLIIAYVGYETIELKPRKDMGTIKMVVANNKLEEVNVTVNTGYQTLPKERATGSFSYVGNKLLNRSVSTNILDRLDGVTSGLIFNKQANKTGGLSSIGGDPGISIRGRSTLFSNTEPLVVLDNFPYDGDLNNINPNDVESVTILKDAAAASIWGVRAGNGVIVLTSKKGKFNQAPKISFNANVTVSGKPDLYSVPQISSKEYIELEKFWFDKGKYNFYLNFPFAAYQVQTPVIEILDKQKKGLLPADQAQAQLDALGKIDARDAYTKYFLRNAVDQQYALNISGGSTTNQYYISGGYDRNLNSLVSDSYNRMNLTANNRLSLFKNRLTVDASLIFSKSKTRTNPSPYGIQLPYEQIVDQSGNVLPVIRDWRQSFKDALSNKGLLDWNYYPFDERLNDNNLTDLTDYRLGLQLGYKIIPKILNIELNYQFQQGNSLRTVNSGLDVYNTRLMINNFAQIDPSGSINYPIPLGGILNKYRNDYNSNSGRLQVNYNQNLGELHEITALVGTEIKDYNSSSSNNTIYGYNESTATNVPVDYFTVFPHNIGSPDKIGYQDGQSGSVDRFFSYFANASYTFNKKYTFSASARKDEANLFGVDANKRGVPLYSLGLSWDINKESFYKSSFLPYLRVRLTNGYNGNLSKALSAYTTARTDRFNFYNTPQQVIVNPPNPELSWEKIHNINAGLDFGFKNNVISGSLDFYSKKGLNLIGDSPVAPQTGVTQFRGNTADMITKGIDLVLNSINLRGKISWTSNFLINYVKDKVTNYKMQTGVNSLYVDQNYANPFVGRPFSSIFAYSWAGLDNKGNPQGYLNGNISKDYRAILNSTNINELKYIGTASPTFFGGLRNTFAYGGIELSFNITYKLGYYFRRGSFNSLSSGYKQADYNNRWMKPGDENKTNVPALIYPADLGGIFYSGSEILVEKGDHLRLQDIQFGYIIPNKRSKLPFSQLKIYGYASNLGIIWRANKQGLDPDYVGGGFYRVANPKSFAIGLKADF